MLHRSLLTEAVLVLEGFLNIAILCFVAHCFRLLCGLSDHLTHLLILLPDLLNLFLIPPFFQLMRRQSINMISYYLLIEALHILNLLLHRLQFLLVCKVFLSLTFLEGPLLISELQDYLFVVLPLFLYLHVKRVNFTSDLTDFFIRQVDRAQNVWVRLVFICFKHGYSWDSMTSFDSFALPQLFKAFLFSIESTCLLCITLDLFWGLTLVIIHVLLNRVSSSQHVENILFVPVLFDPQLVTLAFGLQYFVSL